MYLEHQPIDMLALQEYYPDKQEIILNLVANFISSVNIEKHIKIVTEKRTKRFIKEKANKLLSEIEKGDPAKLLGNFIAEVTKQNANTGVLTFKQIGKNWVEDFEQRFKTDYNIILKTGFQKLDKMCMFKKGELIVLAARPSVGKSCFAANIVDNISENYKKTLLVSLEMTAQQIFERVIAKHSKIRYEKIQSPKGMRNEAFVAITKAIQRIKEKQILLLEKSFLNIDQLIFECENVVAQQKIDFLVIDYLQLLQPSLTYGTTNDKINDMTRKLKSLAKALNLPILLLSQLSRDIEKRVDRTPRLSDLRDSGGIEQDADKVIFLDRDTKDRSTETQLLIAKDRSGPMGEISLYFNGDFQYFEEK
jgi:replicative DNA helicase